MKTISLVTCSFLSLHALYTIPMDPQDLSLLNRTWRAVATWTDTDKQDRMLCLQEDPEENKRTNETFNVIKTQPLNQIPSDQYNIFARRLQMGVFKARELLQQDGSYEIRRVKIEKLMSTFSEELFPPCIFKQLKIEKNKLDQYINPVKESIQTTLPTPHIPEVNLKPDQLAAFIKTAKLDKNKEYQQARKMALKKAEFLVNKQFFEKHFFKQQEQVEKTT